MDSKSTGPAFYREPDGDYIAAFGLANGWLDCRASAVANLPSSVASVSVNPVHLLKCIPVAEADVPAEWLATLNPKE